jgi:hypothetical protein
MKPFTYLNEHLKTDIAPSSTHGIGTFALRDLNVGEDVFIRWDGQTNSYIVSVEEFDTLPESSKFLILKSYENRNEYPFIWFRLFKDSYFNLSNPWAYVNTKETDGNVDSVTKKVIKPIKQGEELFGTYNLKSTILK